jgi:hypothetical protein
VGSIPIAAFNGGLFARPGMSDAHVAVQETAAAVRGRFGDHGRASISQPCHAVLP